MCRILEMTCNMRGNLNRFAYRNALPRLQTVDRNGLPDLIRPVVDQVSVEDCLLERHELHVPHGRGKHGVNENLIRHQAGD